MLAVRSGASTLFAIRLEPDARRADAVARARHAARSRSASSSRSRSRSASTSRSARSATRRCRRCSVRAADRRGARTPTATGACSPDGDLRAHVTLRSLPDERRCVVIPPMGALAVTQKIAPLELPLAALRRAARRRRRARSPSSTCSVGADPRRHRRPVQEQFAAAQFLDMSDAEKLSRRSFEPFEAGVADRRRQRAARRLPARRRRRLRGHLLPQAAPAAASDARERAARPASSAISAAARSKFSATRRAPTGLGTPKVALPHETFVRGERRRPRAARVATGLRQRDRRGRSP